MSTNAEGNNAPGDVADVATTEHMADSLDELRHQLGLPGTPRRRAGGERVGLGQGMEQLEHSGEADGLGHRRDGGVVAQIPAGRDIGQEQMVLHEGHEHFHVSGRQPQAWARSSGEYHSVVGVVAGEALPQVVEQGAQDEQVGPAHPIGERRRVGGRFEQVPVDREPVIGVALRLVANRHPLGEDSHDQAELIERLDGGDRRVPLEQEPDQLVAGAGRPPGRHRRQIRRQPFEGVGVDGDLVPRCRGGDAEDHGRVGRRIDVECEMNRAPADLHPWSDHPVGGKGRGAGRVADAGPGFVGDPRNGAAGCGDLGHEGIGIGEAGRDRHGILVLQPQHVAGATRRSVQGHPHGDERVLGIVELLAIGLDELEPGGLRPCEGLHVAQTTAAVLEIWLQQERDLAGGSVPGGHPLGELGQPARGTLPPGTFGPGANVEGQLGIARDRTCAELRGRRVQIVERQAARLFDGEHAVPELHPAVPERVPDPRRELVDAAAHVMHQHDVEVASWSEQASAVAAHCDQRDSTAVGPSGSFDRNGEDLGQPAVGRLGQHARESPSAQL